MCVRVSVCECVCHSMCVCVCVSVCHHSHYSVSLSVSVSVCQCDSPSVSVESPLSQSVRSSHPCVTDSVPAKVGERSKCASGGGWVVGSVSQCSDTSHRLSLFLAFPAATPLLKCEKFAGYILFYLFA